MSEDQFKIIKLIKPLFDQYKEPLIPADQNQIIQFKVKAKKYGLPEKVVDELNEFYQVANGIPCLEIDIKKIDDDLIFEWWTFESSLWIGQRDMDILRWKEGKYHIGDTADLNYGPEYVFDTIFEMLQKEFSMWY
ncbi:MAG: hypothetical protein AAFZ15_11020 [Bacteroidota bacterium]